MAILFDWYENPKTKDKQDEELTLHPRIRLNGSTGTAQLRRKRISNIAIFAMPRKVGIIMLNAQVVAVRGIMKQDIKSKNT